MPQNLRTDQRDVRVLKKVFKLLAHTENLGGLNLRDLSVARNVRNEAPDRHFVKAFVRLDILFQNGMERPLVVGADAG